jgi:hypothetical protein
MSALPVPTARRSWLAHISAALGLSALLGVLCFHFPGTADQPRIPRRLHRTVFARHLLLVGLASPRSCTGTLAILRDRNRRIATLGVGSATLAVLLGGATVQFDAIDSTPFSLGLDWFVLSLFFSALVFVPHRAAGARQAARCRRCAREWRTDVAYFFMGHVLVQFILIAVTASTGTIAALAAFPVGQGPDPVAAGCGRSSCWRCWWLTWPRPCCIARTTTSRSSGASMPCTTRPGGWTGLRVRASTCWKSS